MGSVVLELQNDCLNNKPIIDILHKAFLVAKKLGLNEFESWISHESDGYPDGSCIPPYRETICELKAKNPNQGWIPYYIEEKEFDDKVRKRRITVSISEIEKLSQCDPTKGNLLIPLDGEEVARLQRISNCSFEICAFISITVMNKICNTVKKIILEWAIDLEKQGILGEGLIFTPEEKNKVMHQTINIGTFQGVLGDMQNSTIEQNLNCSVRTGNKQDLVQALQDNNIEAADIDRLMGAIDADFVATGKDSCLGEEVTNWIDAMIAKTVSGAWNVTSNVASSILTAVISRYYGLS